MQSIPEGIDNDCLVQTWYRFLHILGNPVELSRARVISDTPQFLNYVKSHEPRIEPRQHECLRELPQIFSNAISTLAIIVDGFLGKNMVFNFKGSYLKISPQTSCGYFPV